MINPEDVENEIEKLKEEGLRLERALKLKGPGNMTRAQVFSEFMYKEIEGKIKRIEAKIKRVEVISPGSSYHNQLLRMHLDLLDEKIQKGTKAALAMSMRAIMNLEEKNKEYKLRIEELGNTAPRNSPAFNTKEPRYLNNRKDYLIMHSLCI